MNHRAKQFSLQDFLDACLAKGLVTAEDIARSERISKIEGGRTDRVLNQLGVISDDNFAGTWSEIAGMELVADAEFPDRAILPDKLAAAFLRHTRVVPLREESGRLIVASADALDCFSAAAIAMKTASPVQVRLARPQELTQALDRLYGEQRQPAEDPSGVHAATASDLERLRDLASDAPVIKLVQTIIERAVEARASDIHLTVSRRGPTVKFRVDGVLRGLGDIVAMGLYDAVVSRIKILGGLDIAERRLPQDGSARMVAGGQEVDLRIATMPHFAGEGVVIRVLDRSAISLDFAQLGMSERFVGELKAALDQPSGLVLMTGPTGSGKTTTLYAALRTMVRADRNLITIEDPVEYQLDGVTQIEINHRIGFDFASALRAALRQDPDVILVGEIRDSETASIAARAALTGHLVLASVHTNSAAAALPRLVDMGVEPYLLASTVRAVIAQRLARRVCAHCAAPTSVSADRLRGLGWSNTGEAAEIACRQGRGCVQCGNNGFKGRVAVTEFMSIDRPLRGAITAGAGIDALEAIAVAGGMVRLADHGVELLKQGRTTIGELERVLGAGESMT